MLARYAEHELDQFDHWTVSVPGWGTVFVEIALEHRPDISDSVYTPIWPLPSKLIEPPG